MKMYQIVKENGKQFLEFVKDCNCECHHIFKHCTCDCSEKGYIAECDIEAFINNYECQGIRGAYIYFNTIDFDHSSLAALKLVLEEIAKCPHVKEIFYRDSPSKRGFHVKFFCEKTCVECRLKYDDQLRIKADLLNRKPHQRNVLWDEKCYRDYKTGNSYIKKAGEWKRFK